MSELESRPIEELIARWRVAPTTEWAEVVGHERAIRRLRELAAKLRLPDPERARLGLHLSAGILITGPSGTAKTMLAKGFAHELGRDIIAPPVSELDAERISALYRALAGTPCVVLLDEAEALIGDPEWGQTDETTQRALLGALDGVATQAGPVTIAITAASPNHLSDAATRPGRLAPRLELDMPTAAERAEILRRAADGLPGAATLDLPKVAERLATWSGAEIVGLIEEAMTRSLLLAPEPAGLRDDALLEVVSERFVVRDPVPTHWRDEVLTSRHEAGHALWARQAWGPGSVSVIDLKERGGTTTIVDDISKRRTDRTQLRLGAGMSLAGVAAEVICYGRDGVTAGSAEDRAHATRLLTQIYELEHPLSDDQLEGYANRGAEAMRGARYEAIRAAAETLWADVLDTLRPLQVAIESLGDRVLASPERSLSGPELNEAIEDALRTAATTNLSVDVQA